VDYQLYLRPISEQDLELIHSWNTNPLVIKYYNLPDKVPNSWEDAVSWWRTLGNSLVFVLCVVDVYSPTYWRGHPIGISWVKNLKDNPEIGGYIGDTDYYQSAPAEMYMLTLEAVNRLRGIKSASLKVKKDNQELIGVMGECGWRIDRECDGVVELRYGE